MCHVSSALIILLAAQGCQSAVFLKTIGIKVNIGNSREWFERDDFKRQTVACFAEYLGSVGSVVPLGMVHETAKGYVSVGFEVVPGVCGAKAQAEGTPLRSSINGDMIIIT